VLLSQVAFCSDCGCRNSKKKNQNLATCGSRNSEKIENPTCDGSATVASRKNNDLQPPQLGKIKIKSRKKTKIPKPDTERAAALAPSCRAPHGHDKTLAIFQISIFPDLRRRKSAKIRLATVASPGYQYGSVLDKIGECFGGVY